MVAVDSPFDGADPQPARNTDKVAAAARLIRFVDMLPPLCCYKNDGTIARGHSLYEFENTNEDYDRAKLELTNPLDSTMVDFDRGKELYDIYCGLCHGNKGDGQGNLVKREKILGIAEKCPVNRTLQSEIIVKSEH